ncbi:aspartate kinase, partial [Candidatus Bipolaricaulota bacterium]|nr:aspartate kinase [Candidatus Bipolaricaulota bacterium]
MSSLIMKFGGTSVADAEAIRRVANILREQRASGHRIVAVVSAMGGVTDALTRGVRAAVVGDESICHSVADEILRRTSDACAQLVPSHKEREALLDGARKIMAGYESVCQSVLVLAEVTPRVLDRATACGEPLVASLLAAHLRTLGIESRAIQAEDVIVTDDTY